MSITREREDAVKIGAEILRQLALSVPEAPKVQGSVGNDNGSQTKQTTKQES